MIESDAVQMTKSYEGFSNKIYLDSLGHPTGGWGSCMYIGKALPNFIWQQIFEYDYWQAERDYERLNLELNEVRRAVMVDLLYNMGFHVVSGFNRMLRSLHIGDYVMAEYHLLDSLYAKQTGIRAKKNGRMLRTGALL